VLPALLALVLGTLPVGAQSRAALGLTAIGAVEPHLGYATLPHGATAVEAGLRMDLGHLPLHRLRLTASGAFLRSLRFTEFVESDHRSFSGSFFDLSGDVSLMVLLAPPAGAVVPYLSGGVGVHVLSSSFGSLTIDQRYNSNSFGLSGAAGMRLRLGTEGRRGLFVEGRREGAHAASRWTARAGYSLFFADLAAH
jgi:hypothetical protein